MGNRGFINALSYRRKILKIFQKLGILTKRQDHSRLVAGSVRYVLRMKFLCGNISLPQFDIMLTRSRVAFAIHHSQTQPAFQVAHQHLPDLLRLAARLLEQVALAELDQHTFRAGRDQAGVGLNEHVPLARRRTGNIGQFQDAGT